MTEGSATSDQRGRKFIPFAVDIRFGSAAWREDDIVGCFYTASNDLFVKRGDAYFPAALLLGKTVRVAVGVCEPQKPAERA